MAEYYVDSVDKFNFFAKVDDNSTVVQVIALEKEKCNNLDYPASEKIGQEFIKNLGLTGNWLQTSYTGEFRSAYATPNSLYDSEKEQFVAKQPYPSWTYDKEKNVWNPPIPKPNDGNLYLWDEETQTWFEDYEVE